MKKKKSLKLFYLFGISWPYKLVRFCFIIAIEGLYIGEAVGLVIDRIILMEKKVAVDFSRLFLQ